MAFFTNFRINGSLNDQYVDAMAPLSLVWQVNLESYEELSYFNVVIKRPGVSDVIMNHFQNTTATYHAHATQGKYDDYKIVMYYVDRTIGGSGTQVYVSSPTIRIYSYKAPGHPESRSLAPGSVFPAKTSRMSWSAAPPGVGVSVSKYEVYRDGTLLGSTTGLYMDVTAPTTVGTSSLQVKAIGSVAGYDSILSPPLPHTVLDPVAIGSLDKSTVPMDGSSKIKLTITPKSDTLFTHKAIWKTGNATVTQNLAAGVKEATLTVPLAWCAQYPNATSGTASVTLETYDGATKRGEKAYNFTVTVPASVVPTFTSVGAVLVLNGVDSSITRYVQGYSKATLAINGAAGAQGSTITALSITGAGKTVNAATGSFGPFTSSGQITFTGKITDSRGRTTTKNTTITVQPYAKPSLSGAVAYRCLSNGTKNSSGTYALLKATSVFSSIDGQNTATLQGRVYMKGATPGAWQTMTSGSNLITGGGGLLVTKSYIAEIRITDKINNYILRFDIPTEIIGFHALDGATGAAVGKYAETPGEFQIPEHWRARMNLQIKDVRDTNPSPDEMPEKAVSTFFNNQYGNNWRSGITVRGWGENYQTWQLAAPSSNSDHENLFFRVGRGASWGAWRTLLTDGNYNDYAPTKTGGGASGSWGISITGNAATASTATKLTTARTLTIGSTGKTFNGTGNVSWSLAEIGAAASSHSHSYLPLSGGTITGDLIYTTTLQYNAAFGGWSRGLGYRTNDASSGIGFIGAFGNSDTLTYLAMGTTYNDPKGFRWYPNGTATLNGSQVLHSGNYTSYAADKNHVHGVETFSLTAATGAEIGNGTECFAIGKLVVIAMSVWRKTEGSFGLAVVPVGFRPKVDLRVPGAKGITDSMTIDLSTNGNINTPIDSTSEFFRAVFVYSRA